MHRRVWPSEEKAAIVLELIRGQKSVAAICTRHGDERYPVYRLTLQQ
jgi:transposase-like protein